MHYILEFSLFILGVGLGFFIRRLYESTKIIGSYVVGFKHGMSGDVSLLERLPQSIKDKYNIEIIYKEDETDVEV